MTAAPRLPLILTRLTFRAEEPLRLHAHAGFAWRGVFGWALKRTVCAMRMRPCDGCMLAGSCLYPYVFETSPPESARKMTLYESVPHPFALYTGPVAERSLNAGDPVSVDLTVFGNASRHLAYFLHAFEVAGHRGISARRARLSLLRAESLPLDAAQQPETIYQPDGMFCAPPATEALVPACPGLVVLEISTPLRLKENGNLVAPTTFAARHLLSSLVRRISMLMYFHTDDALSADFRDLKTAAKCATIVHRDLRWLDLTRKSSRQGTMMQMGGIVGRVEIHLGEAEALWPYLWLGQFTQAGKGTTMGLGRYQIITPAGPMAPPAR
jgi:hypothetical protein